MAGNRLDQLDCCRSLSPRNHDDHALGSKAGRSDRDLGDVEPVYRGCEESGVDIAGYLKGGLAVGVDRGLVAC